MNFENLTIGQVKLLTEQFVEIAKTTNLFNNSTPRCYTENSAESSLSDISAESIIHDFKLQEVKQ